MSRLRFIEEKPRRRAKRILIGASIGVLLACSVGMGILAFRFSREKQRANREAQAATKALEFVASMFDIANPDVSPGKIITAREILEHGLAKAEDLKDQPLLQASILDTLGSLNTKLGQYKEALPILERALRLKEQALGPARPEVSDTLYNLANLYGRLGKFKEAEALFRRGLDIMEKSHGPNHPDVVNSLIGLATALRKQGKLAEAEVACQRALTLLQSKLGPDHPKLAPCLNQMANIYRLEKKYDLAEPLFLQALALREKEKGRDHPSVGASLNNLAELYIDQGKFTPAEGLFLRALGISERAYGPNHPETRIALYNLASLEAQRGRKEEALRWLAEDVKRGEDDPGIAEDKTFASLHGMPRFEALLAEVKQRSGN